MVSNSLMNSSDEMRPRTAGELETEFPVAVSLGGAGNFHAIGEIDEQNFVAGAGLAGGAVSDSAGQGLGDGGGEGDREDGS